MRARLEPCLIVCESSSWNLGDARFPLGIHDSACSHKMTYVCKVAQAQDPYQASSGSSQGDSADDDGVNGWAIVLPILVFAAIAAFAAVVIKRRMAHKRAIAGKLDGPSLRPVTNAPTPTYVVGLPLASQGDV